MTVAREALEHLGTIEQRLARLVDEIRRGFAQVNRHLTASESRLAAVEMRLSAGAAKSVTSPDHV